MWDLTFLFIRSSLVLGKIIKKFFLILFMYLDLQIMIIRKSFLSNGLKINKFNGFYKVNKKSLFSILINQYIN